jgi:hypothetical protein
MRVLYNFKKLRRALKKLSGAANRAGKHFWKQQVVNISGSSRRKK